MTIFDDLARQCRDATSNSWDLDRAIFKACHLPDTWFGSKVTNWFGDGPFGCDTEDGVRHLDCINAPNYTASIDAALTLIPKDCWWSIEQVCAPDSPLRNFGSRNGIFMARVAAWSTRDPSLVATNDSPALALCAAALKARSFPAQKSA